MGMSDKQFLIQNKNRLCPLCGKVIEHDELIGRRKYHQVCGALLKRSTDITRMRFRFWYFVSRWDCPPTETEVKLIWQKIAKESAQRVLKKARNLAWLEKIVSQYYKKPFHASYNDIKQKLPHLEVSLKAKGENGDAIQYMQRNHVLRDRYSYLSAVSPRI
jgi:ribosomal protein S27AE